MPREPAEFDPAQLQQVLINLLKNAHESGSAPDDVRISIDAGTNVWQLNVLDRGSGMSEEVLRNALLPFYSTKPAGTGLGLTLSREVLEAHGGRITLANREGGACRWRSGCPAPGPPAEPVDKSWTTAGQPSSLLTYCWSSSIRGIFISLSPTINWIFTISGIKFPA